MLTLAGFRNYCHVENPDKQGPLDGNSVAFIPLCRHEHEHSWTRLRVLKASIGPADIGSSVVSGPAVRYLA
jgi:hypothetical protein